MSKMSKGPSSTWNRDVVDVDTGSRFQAKQRAAKVRCAHCRVGQGDDGDTVVLCKMRRMMVRIIQTR